MKVWTNFLLGLTSLIIVLLVVNMQKNLPQRENVKFMTAQGKSPIQCWRALIQVYGEEAMSKPTVRRWHKRFREGDGLTPTTDLLRSGRPRTQTTAPMVDTVRRIIQRNGRLSIKKVASQSGLSWSTAQKILRKHLKLRRRTAKFIPRLLTDEQKRARVQMCTQNLDRLRNDPYLLDKLVCGDESPVYIMDPESKFESSVWLPAGAPRPVKALRSRSQRWTMLTCFFDSIGPILVEFSEDRIDTDSYITTLRRLRERIRQKHPGMWIGGVDGKTDREFVIQHDNASPHTSNRTIAFLFDQDLLAHPPYSLDLVPADFFLFPLLKTKLRGIHHGRLPQVKRAVRRALKSIPEDQFQAALIALPTRWRKCITAQGEYFEGRGIQPAPGPYFDMPPQVDPPPESTDSDSD